MRLPPERELATSLGVNRTTTMRAYQELAADGVVEARPGRGTVVRSSRESADDNAGGDTTLNGAPALGGLAARLAPRQPGTGAGPEPAARHHGHGDAR